MIWEILSLYLYKEMRMGIGAIVIMFFKISLISLKNVLTLVEDQVEIFVKCCYFVIRKFKVSLVQNVSLVPKLPFCPDFIP